MKLVEVYHPKDSIEAHLLSAALNDAGIVTCIEGEEIQGIVGESPPGWMSAPRILVSDAQAGTARELLARLEKKRHR